jgi:hypothetical protein
MSMAKIGSRAKYGFAEINFLSELRCKEICMRAESEFSEVNFVWKPHALKAVVLCIQFSFQRDSESFKLVCVRVMEHAKPFALVFLEECFTLAG